MNKGKKRQLNILKREIQRQKKEMRRQKRNRRELNKLIFEQRKDQLNPNGTYNNFKPKSKDIYAHRRRTSGSAFKNQ